MLNQALIIKAIKKVSSDLIEDMELEKNVLDRLKKAYFEFKDEALESWLIKDKRKEFAYPVEGIKFKNCIDITNINQNLSENRWAFDRIRNKKVLALDTSEMTSHHITPYFILINIGYFFYDYEKNQYLEESIPKFYTKKKVEEIIEESRISSWILQYLRLEEYANIIEEISNRIDIKGSYVFLDESLSSSFLASMKENVIEKIMEKLFENINLMIKKGTYPIAVFYSMARPFINFLNKDTKLEEIKISDKQLFDKILKVGQRSPLLKIENLPCSLINKTIYTFYIKVSEGNVLRVEIPEELENMVDEISKIVFLQSIIGGGYPYCMERAHEQAYLSEREKRFILSMLDKELPGIYPVKMSKKLERKLLRII
jgi:NurA-like 5'-3' nuclease